MNLAAWILTCSLLISGWMVCDGVFKAVDAELLKPSRAFGAAVYPGLGGLVVAEKAATLDVVSFFVSG